MMKLQLDDTRKCVEEGKAEQQQLEKIIADGDTEQIRLKKQLEQVKTEDDDDDE